MNISETTSLEGGVSFGEASEQLGFSKFEVVAK